MKRCCCCRHLFGGLWRSVVGVLEDILVWCYGDDGRGIIGDSETAVLFPPVQRKKQGSSVCVICVVEQFGGISSLRIANRITTPLSSHTQSHIPQQCYGIEGAW